MTLRRAVAFALALVVVACGRPPTPTAAPSSPVPTGPPASTASAAPSRPVVEGSPVDLPGTAWQAIRMRGRPVPPRAPEIEFDFAGRPSGTGFTGCEDFGWDGTFAAGEMEIGELVLAPFDCAAEPGMSTQDAFLETFRRATSYATGGDTLVIVGPSGEIVFGRLAPPSDDPGRPVFDRLRSGVWELLSAPDVLAPNLLARAQFADRWLISVGDCGYTGRVRFDAGSRIDIIEVGWDSMACPGDAAARERDRHALARALEQVDTYEPAGQPGSIRLVGPDTEVLLGP
jgi:heat shock protein HslJ